jgi:4-oxalmesaconate hydratase
MIIDCHGHYTDRAEGPASVPQGADRGREEQVRDAAARGLKMSDDEIRESLEGNQIACRRSAAPT